MVVLTKLNNKKIAINHKFIAIVEPTESETKENDGCCVWFTKNQSVYVQEDFDYILNQINQLKNQSK